MKDKLKNAFRIIYAGAVCCVLAVPSAVLIRSELQNPDADAEEVTAENRVLADKPQLRTEDGALNKDFTMQYESWFSDRFGLRTQLVTAYGKLTSKLFGVSSEKDVIIGRDGWVYFTPTIPDATGVRSLNDAEIRHCVRNLQLMRDYAAQHGAAFVFAAAPNKASIYPDNLPARYLHTGSENNLDALSDALRQSDLTVCDWRTVLRDAAASGDRQLYHKLDTHWNGDGAMLGYQTLMQTLSLDDRGYADAERTETCDWEGDLWGMLSPAEQNPDRNAVYAVPQTYRTIGRMRSIDDLSIKTACDTGEGSLLMFRDSFGRALIPLLAERFASCTFQRANAIPLDMLETAPADYVVYELVERNLQRLLTYAPRMPAPYAEIPAAEPADGAMPIRMESEQAGAYLHVYGLFDAAYDNADAVYLTVNGQTYEAFLACEQEALELEQHQANGFSAYLPADSASGTVAVTVLSDGRWVQAGTAEIQLSDDAA